MSAATANAANAANVFLCFICPALLAVAHNVSDDTESGTIPGKPFAGP